MPLKKEIPTNKGMRNSSIELLRIISMVMIVACHFATHSGFTYNSHTLSIPRFWLSFIEMGGKVGVDVFILISGYFLITDKRLFNLKRLLKFWGQVFFYSAGIYCVFSAIGVIKFSPLAFVQSLLPVTFSTWWFAAIYFVLYLIHPFINILLHKLDKSTYQKMLILLFVIWSIIPTFTTSKFQGNVLLWFVFLYCLARYIRLFGLNPKGNVKKYVILFVVFTLIRYATCIGLILLGTKVSAVAGHSLYFYDQQSVFTLLCAVTLFMIFEKITIPNNKIINLIASASFGVYLMHDNKHIRSFIWQTIFKGKDYQNSLMLILYSLLAVLIIYLVGTIIDLIRQKAIERPFMFVVNKFSNSWKKPFKALYKWFIDIVF